MMEIDSQMVGKVKDDEIYQLQADLYRSHVKEPLERQGIEAPDVTAQTCKDHFSKHRLKYLNELKKVVRDRRVRVRVGRLRVRSYEASRDIWSVRVALPRPPDALYVFSSARASSCVLILDPPALLVGQV